MEAFRQRILQLAPFFGERVNELQDWEQIKLLTVQINRLRRWYRDGLLCIGDAAHAMSPAGGVGINLAIQDAVAAANILAGPLRDGTLGLESLAAVQRRREFPTRVTQAMQIRVHNMFARIFGTGGPFKVPWPVKAIVRIPGVRWALAYVVGIGVRPEHVNGARHAAQRRRTGVAIAVGAAVGVVIALFVVRAGRVRARA